MKANFDASVITISYNAGNSIEKTILSVINQKNCNIQYIIIDGGSTDCTLKKINSYREYIDILVVEPDNGIYDAMNKGLHHAIGGIISFLNAGDVFSSTYSINSVVKVFYENDKTELLLSPIRYFDPNSFKLNRFYGVRYFSPKLFKIGIMPPHLGCFLSFEFARKVGKFSTSYKIAGDFDFMYRAFQLHPKYEKIDNTLVYMEAGGISSAGLNSFLSISNEINCILGRSRLSAIFLNFRIFFKLWGLFFGRLKGGKLNNLENIND